MLGISGLSSKVSQASPRVDADMSQPRNPPQIPKGWEGPVLLSFRGAAREARAASGSALSLGLRV